MKHHREIVAIASAVLLHLFLPCEEAGSLDKIDVSPSVASLSLKINWHKRSSHQKDKEPFPHRNH